MDLKFVHGWWLPSEDVHFDDYFQNQLRLTVKNFTSQNIYPDVSTILRKKYCHDIGAHCGFGVFI